MNTQELERPQRHPAWPASTGTPGGAPGPQGHGTPAPGGGNRTARGALALGVVGLSTSVVIVGGLLGVVGLGLGLAALRTARRTGVGRGRAVAGVVTSALAITVSVTAAFLFVWYANQTQECYEPDSFRQYTQCVHDQFDGA
ncbi:DUF4190 domain-containing protein [Streptomyces sp. NRRL B-1347]|uniref:DUF4190 domain-containing protein n=1 Tax=Streptomyces sp. NRRL B-1347 TaxID=1476877 RepID=UPI000ABD8D30|nr:DUF4190 domain-containing protein [Streptomyces sp. NRRL B-1347]